MKAISLWQPWASAVVTGAKRIETRSWHTPHRGLLAIHAAKRLKKGELVYYGSCWPWCGALGLQMGNHGFLWDILPFGAIVAVCRLVDCKSTNAFTVGELDTPEGEDHYAWTQRQMGDFAPGRWGWVLEDIQALPEPIPFRGWQRLFNVPDELIGAAL